MNELGAGGAEAFYLNLLRQGQFRIQSCGACKRHVFFPRQLCPHCGSRALEWVTPRGTGSVYSATVVSRKPAAGGDYCVCLVDLDENVRLMSRVDGIDPEAVAIGMRVRARIVTEDDRPLLVFEPEVGQ
ncbi:MAG: OB-fold domain-containing protein [Aquisalimonadaceae bacterium]